MDELAFWKQKILQAFHDPPGKPYAFFSGTGGHLKLAQRLFRRFAAQDLRHYARRPDLAASGADRPVMNGPRGSGLQLGTVQYHRSGNNLVTHPLACGYALRLPHSGTAPPAEANDQHQAGAGPDVGSPAGPLKRKDILELFQDQESALDGLGPVEWGDATSLREGYRVLWRRYRDELRKANPAEGLLWERIPGDSRVPDHSIWEHLKVVSALAFLDREPRQKVPVEKEPWLFTFSLTPVQEFITASRKSRDLWLSSFLLAELAWHAMLPIVEHYGPDAIVYPELRGNPRVDNWLYHHHRDALPESAPYPITHAALLPETFVAILPQGGVGHLRALDDVARDCAERMQRRWQELSGEVRKWLVNETKDTPGWTRIWDRQHQHPPITSYWSAVHWQAPRKIESAEELARSIQGGALPAQDRTLLPLASEETRRLEQERQARLGAWMPAEVWAHYQEARAVFGQVNLGYLQNERGFDYAPTHHELRMRQRLRKQEARYQAASAFEEQGEKCTQCRQREALYDEAGSQRDTIDRQRERVRQFWAQEALDAEQLGAERLCGVCAFKRFLVKAGGARQGINTVWGEPPELERELREHGEVRFPFPSTTAVAAQAFLAKLAQSNDVSVRQALAEVVAAHRKTELPRTLFFETLPQLAVASRTSSLARDFLMIEPQESCFPEALQTQLDRQRKGSGQDSAKYRALVDLQNAATKLRRAALEAEDPKRPKQRLLDDPDTHIAVVMLDGDRMGKLLLGSADTVGARWRDVIHPRVVDKLDNGKLAETGWAGLLNAPRLMGPSLHAFISRALADFCHHIVPWVVEQEYGGRLIYCGGDDVLALLPAKEALPMAARLQQLFSAAWIVDTCPQVSAWSWRQSGSEASFKPAEAQQRFVIPKPVGNARIEKDKAPSAIELPLESKDVVTPIELKLEELASGPFDGQVLAGLGPRCSLSASIVYGHFKTELPALLRRGRWLLDHVAKEEAGRGTVALAHHSRGGLESELALKWKAANETAAGIPELEAEQLVSRVVKGFQKGSLTSKLPYKLREVSPLLLVPPDDEKRRMLALGLLRQAMDRKSSDGTASDESEQRELEQAALTLWLAGYSHRVRRCGDRALQRADAECSVEGLLLCRYLAGHGGEGE